MVQKSLSVGDNGQQAIDKINDNFTEVYVSLKYPDTLWTNLDNPLNMSSPAKFAVRRGMLYVSISANIPSRAWPADTSVVIGTLPAQYSIAVKDQTLINSSKSIGQIEMSTAGDGGRQIVFNNRSAAFTGALEVYGTLRMML